MMTREEALAYGMSFDNVYEEKPFRDPNWQLVRIKGSKKTFLWIYEREGYINQSESGVERLLALDV